MLYLSETWTGRHATFPTCWVAGPFSFVWFKFTRAGWTLSTTWPRYISLHRAKSGRVGLFIEKKERGR